MTVRIVHFGFPERELVALDDNEIMTASSEAARSAVQDVLRHPVRAGATAEATTLLHPGDPGHLQAALESLPDATITEAH